MLPTPGWQCNLQTARLPCNLQGSQGHVKLSGTVSSPEDIGRAVALALEADGVRDATSALVVKPKPN